MRHMFGGCKTAMAFVLFCVLGLVGCSGGDDKPAGQDGQSGALGLLDGVWAIDVEKSLQEPQADADSLNELRAAFDAMTVHLNMRDGVLFMEANGRKSPPQRLFFVRTEADGAQVYDREHDGPVSLRSVNENMLVLRDGSGAFVLVREK